MTKPIAGLHHVTAMCGDPQRNLDFYSGVLGLRLVKRTVNFDDPGTYHLYYGDGAGTPGTIMTFFAWPGARRGSLGVGQVTVTALRIPAASTSYWRERLREHGVAGVELIERQGEQVIAFADPDGMHLELVAAEPGTDTIANWQAWSAGPIPEEHAIHGLHGVTATLAATGATMRLLTEILGLEPVGTVAKRRVRFASVPAGSFAPQSIDLIELPDGHPGRVAVGTVHHIAWRVENDAEQAAWREKLVGLGIGASPVIDRTYFHAIYFREPGGVLFEIATNPPGFTADGEDLQTLGNQLQVPPWLEGQRERLEQTLPPLRQPATAQP